MAAVGATAALLLLSGMPAAAQVWAAPDASVKFDVKPKKAKVYVDGFYAGIVDDFDSPFQRLYTAPGAHEITLFLEGYRTHTDRAYLAPDHTFKVKLEMEKLPAGEVSELPPAPSAPPPPQQPAIGPRGRNTRRGPEPPDQAPASGERARGTLELTLEPADAEVLVDGQPWQRSGSDHVTMDLAEGRHNLQVRKSGFVGYLTDVDIRPAETTTLNVNLRAQAPR
jgi:PEGA domain